MYKRQIRNSFQAAALLSFELDLFGRLRRATESARAELLATEEGWRTVILSLITAVASNYVQLRSLAKVSAERTTLIIAHRLSTVRWAHAIHVLEAGRICLLYTSRCV